jgi:hypothetical protein
MTHSEDDLFDDPTESDDEAEDYGEDHRGDNPGYDLDEQAAIEDLEAEED